MRACAGPWHSVPTMAPRLTAYALTPAGSPRLLALRSLVGITGIAPERRTTDVHIGYVGSWKGHHQGPFTLTREDLASCVEEFESRRNPIRGDYEHASCEPPSGLPVLTCGWVQSLRVVGDHLWARVEFTERAARLIRQGEYRFCSGVFAFNVPDRALGSDKLRRCVLRSFALTDDPFIDGQHPITLSARRLTGAPRMDIPKAALLAALDAIDGDSISEEALGPLMTSVLAMEAAKNPETVEPAETTNAADPPKPDDATCATPAPPPPAAKPEDEIAAAAPPTPPPPPAPPAEQATDDAGKMIGAKLATATGMEPAALLAAIDTNLDAVVSAIRGTAGQAPALAAQALSHQLTTANRALAAANARIARYEERDTAARHAEIDRAVDAMVAEGRIAPTNKPQWVALGRKSPAEFRALADTIPKNAAFPAGRDPVLASKDPGATSRDIVSDAPVDEASPEFRNAAASLSRMGITDAKEQTRILRAQFAKTKQNTNGQTAG